MINVKKRALGLLMALVMFVSVLAPVALNQQQVQAASPYYIQVNKSTNVVTVFKSKVNGVYKNPVKAFLCSAGNATPLGTFKTPAKYRWHVLDGPSYGQYCTRIHGGILFHSVWYYENGNKSSISVTQYNKLGSIASHGCIRLTVADAKWIYDNCALGTEVKIISGSSKNDSLGKPEALKLSTSKRTDWCPTDPDPKNPYANKKPRIEGAKNLRIQVGTKLDLKKNIKAYDTVGNSATSKLKVTGSVNTKKEGTYTVTYSITDAIKRTATKKIKVVVYDDSKLTITAKDQKVQIGSKFDPLKGVTAKTGSGIDRTKTLKVSGKVNTSVAGKYKLTYSATKTNGSVVKKTVTITVGDYKKPVLKGVVNRTILTSEIATGGSINLLKGVTATGSDGKDLTKRIKVTGKVNPKKAGKYKVTYSVTNDYGVTTKKTVVITIKKMEYVSLEGVQNYTIKYRDSWMLDEEKIQLIRETILKDVTGYVMGMEQPDEKLEIEIVEQDLDVYAVTITLKDDSGHTVQGQCKVTMEYAG